MKTQTTTILVRPAARGGKYLGHDAANTNNKSAVVLVLNAKTEEIITFGVANAPNAASAGPPNLMNLLRRCDPFATDSQTVQVQLQVEISEPTDFRIRVFGPLKHLDQARIAQADITVLPGINIGTPYSPDALMPTYPEGVVVEIPGLCISNVAPPLDWKASHLTCTAKVTMMCGCEIHDDPTWYWPSTDYSIQMVTYMQSGAVHFYPLDYYKSSNPNIVSYFIGQWQNQAAPNDSIVQAWLYASEPKLGNQGKYQIFPAQSMELSPEMQKMLKDTGLSI